MCTADMISKWRRVWEDREQVAEVAIIHREDTVPDA